jgi:hypothetical protein
MCVQHDLEVMRKIPKKEGKATDFHEFWSGKFCYKNYPK